MKSRRSPKPLVLDAGALIAYERADPRMRALLRGALAKNVPVVVPAGVLGQVWRDDARQVVLRALVDAPTSTVVPLDRTLAQACGVLCRRAGTSDVVDASVVLTARRLRAAVVTGDVEDLRRLDPTLVLHEV
jgi:hypothetical protein